MSTGGLSITRLARMHDVMAGYVERGQIPGIVTLISRRGETHVEAIGSKSLGSSDAIQRDAIFRISSMTKPITAVAAMILVEECQLRMDDPVDHLLPELADRTVLKRLDGPLDDTVPANRPITLRDLLTFRLGFGLILAGADATPILQAADKLRVSVGPPAPVLTPEPDEWIRRLGSLPLMRQPGERWMYHTGSDVLGILIARASGQPLETFLRERIFEPLGMKDTSFSVPAEKVDRFLPSYSTNWETGELTLSDPAEGGQWNRPPTFPSGGGGLVSTIDDYLALGELLLNKGKHGRERILSRLSVEVMTTDQLLPEEKVGADPILGDNRGWGFGLAVVTKRDDVAAVPGKFGWDGGLGTSWASDPTEDLVAILMTQCDWSSPRAL
ncbi:MAG TPA: serine hydrolase domain-containing protein, partial [Dehalococcoidia bacterium]|nr:serine hydrolase domain-containing protein [Dehalococcoidia bacterium]